MKDKCESPSMVGLGGDKKPPSLAGVAERVHDFAGGAAKPRSPSSRSAPFRLTLSFATVAAIPFLILQSDPSEARVDPALREPRQPSSHSGARHDPSDPLSRVRLEIPPS